MKQSIEEGTITKQDIEEFEKMIGMDVKQMAKMIDSGKIDKRALQSLGPDFVGMLDIFKKLAALKK